jgi:O-phospho-L-seryl-tRNASec:L-selenocysteinyl-tRNA synthase
MGATEWRRLVKRRKENYAKLSSSLANLAQKHHERLLVTKGNPISLGDYDHAQHRVDSFSLQKAVYVVRIWLLISTLLSAFTLSSLPKAFPASEIGSMLFTRGVSGVRVLVGDQDKTIEGHTFKGMPCSSNTLLKFVITLTHDRF